LLRRGPLRTARAAFTAGSSSKLRDGAGFVPHRREDPLPQPPYVVFMRAPVDGVPHQGVVRRSVHHEVSNLPSDSDGLTAFASQLTCPRQRPFQGPGTAAGYPASYPATATWRSSHERCGFLLAFAHRHSLLGHPVPARRIPPFLTVGLPRRRSGPDSVGVPAFRTCEKRPGWVPSLLRGGGVVPVIATSMTGACRFSTASPVPRCNIPSARVGITKHTKIHSRSPVRSSPRPPSPDGTRTASAFPLGFAPHGHP
jgi:hypothetical protein